MSLYEINVKCIEEDHSGIRFTHRQHADRKKESSTKMRTILILEDTICPHSHRYPYLYKRSSLCSDQRSNWQPLPSLSTFYLKKVDSTPKKTSVKIKTNKSKFGEVSPQHHEHRLGGAPPLSDLGFAVYRLFCSARLLNLSFSLKLNDSVQQ